MSGISGVLGYSNPYQNYIYQGVGKPENQTNVNKSDSEEKSFAKERADKRAGIEECETCKNRKYQDGSDEMVSFKSAAHVSPQAAGAAVRAHEQEHVANAYDKAAKGDGKVLQASVSIHTSTCPECGRTYVSGGETRTQIKYGGEDNPYTKAKKDAEAQKAVGANLDIAI